MKTHIRKIGNSAGAILPAILLKKLNLSDGDSIEINEDKNRIIITPYTAKVKYSLKELLSQCDKNAPQSGIIEEWDNAIAVGREVL